jgi:MFS family permease
MTAAIRWTTYIALPALALFQAVSHYVTRGHLAVYLLDSGLDHQLLDTTFTAASIGTIAGAIVAGAICALAKPWAALITPALTAITGVMFAVSPPVPSLLIGLSALEGFAHGAVCAAMFGAAAFVFRGAREHLRTSSMFTIWLAIGLGGLAGPGLGAAIVESLGYPTMFFASALLASIAFVIGLAALIVSIVSKPDKPAPATEVRGAHLAAVAVLATIGALAWVAFDVVSNLVITPVYELPTDQVASLLLTSSQIALPLSALGAAVFGVLQVAKVRFPYVLLIAALGALLITIVGVCTIWADVEHARSLLFALGIAEACFAPVVLSRFLGDLPYRLEVAAYAVWVVLTRGGSILLYAIGLADMLGASFAVLALFAAITFGAMAFAHARLFPKPADV